jgi:5-methylcytosine-specific restriction endonuclease McrBC GTP-binding regulatory subunit McrB
MIEDVVKEWQKRREENPPSEWDRTHPGMLFTNQSNGRLICSSDTESWAAMKLYAESAYSGVYYNYPQGACYYVTQKPAGIEIGLWISYNVTSRHRNLNKEQLLNRAHNIWHIGNAKNPGIIRLVSNPIRDSAQNICDKMEELIDLTQGYIYRIIQNEPLPPSLTQEPNMSLIEEAKKLLETNYNLILTGAPGTGKTYLAKQIAKRIISEEDVLKCIGFVQFHPSYDYTDFVEGLRPTRPNKDGQIGFERKDGVFKEFCKKAVENQDKDFVFIIDEINRGEISKIFGELFFSIDPGYRGIEGKVNTQYQNMIDDNDIFKNGFYIPDNVYIIGTMNDIDRSVESFDFAMRRRFIWKEVKAEDNLGMLDKLGEGLKAQAKNKLIAINNVIGEISELSSAYHIGGAYFLKLENYKNEQNPFDKLWDYHLEPLLREYLRGKTKEEIAVEIEKLKSAYNG